MCCGGVGVMLLETEKWGAGVGEIVAAKTGSRASHAGLTLTL